MSEKIKIYETGGLIDCPLLATRGLVIMPGCLVGFDVGRKASEKSADAAMRSGKLLAVVTQRDISEDEPTAEGVFKIATLVKVKQVMKLNNDSIRLLVRGMDRIELTQIRRENGHLQTMAMRLERVLGIVRDIRDEASLRMLRSLFDSYCEFITKPADDVIADVTAATDIGIVCDIITANTFMSHENKQLVLEELDPYKRADFLISTMQKEIEILKVEHEIALRVKEQIDGNQREYYLKEQLRAIQTELGDNEQYDDGLGEYASRIDALEASDEIKEKLYKELDHLAKMPPMSHEGSVMELYLDTVLDFPFGKKNELNTDLALAQSVLDQDHYGMDKVKRLVIEHLAVRALCNAGGQILCLVGPPGVGKTSVAKSIARAMNRNYSRVSLGGIRDEAEIRGHRRTYIGSMPGRIAAALRKSGSMNPLLLLDEIDKLCSDFRGDPASAMLEVLDSEQNVKFEDHYLDFPLDLSDVFFVATANTVDTIPRPLLDRMDIIELSSYLDTEKISIAEQFLIPKQRTKNGLKASQIRFDKSVIPEIISSYTRESGVRELERKLADIMRRAAKMIVSGEAKSVRVTPSNIEKFLDTRKFRDEPLYDNGMVGIVNGLAWTSVGGEILNVEVSVLDGSGKIDCTGSLGEVMKESARAAVSYIRSVASFYDIDADFYKTRDIHIHFPEGAVPKDGPSAGIAIATALVSALSLTPVKNTVAMTGEITLTGRVLPIGGLKEKTMAAYKHGIHTVIIPYYNLPDLADIDATVRESIRFISAKTVDEVFKSALEPASREACKTIYPVKDKKPAAATAVLN